MGESLQCCNEKDQYSSNFKNSNNSKDSNNFEERSRETNEKRPYADYKNSPNFLKKIAYYEKRLKDKGYISNTVENPRSNNCAFIENLDSRKNYPEEAQSDQNVSGKITEKTLEFDNQQTYGLQNVQKIQATRKKLIESVSDQINDHTENNLNSEGGEFTQMNYFPENNTGYYQKKSLQCYENNRKDDAHFYDTQGLQYYDNNRIDDAQINDPQSYSDQNQIYHYQQNLNPCQNNYDQKNYEILDNNTDQHYYYEDRNMNYVNFHDKTNDASHFYNTSNDKSHAYNTQNY